MHRHRDPGLGTLKSNTERRQERSTDWSGNCLVMFREERCESLLERECPVEQNIAVAVIVSVRHESMSHQRPRDSDDGQLTQTSQR